MPQVYKANPAPIGRGQLYSTLQLKGFKITVKSPPITLLDADDPTYSAGLYSQATSLAQEFGTTSALFELKSTSTYNSCVFVGDGHALDQDIVAIRADKALGGTGVLTVAAAVGNSFVAQTALVTVSQIDTLYNITS
jgi:hypothetical protein